jgi:hypothetical protein
VKWERGVRKIMSSGLRKMRQISSSNFDIFMIRKLKDIILIRKKLETNKLCNGF